MLQNTANQAIMHGENLIKPVELPKCLKEVKHKGLFIFAHSETGHNHVIEAPVRDNFRILEDKEVI